MGVRDLSPTCATLWSQRNRSGHFGSQDFQDNEGRFTLRVIRAIKGQKYVITRKDVERLDWLGLLGSTTADPPDLGMYIGNKPQGRKNG